MHKFHRLALSAARVAFILSLAAPAIAREPAREQAQENAAPGASPTLVPAQIGNCGMPIWPKSSLRAGEQGKDTLSVLVGINGEVVQSTVFKSSGFTALDEATFKMFPRCKFKPAVRDGVPEQGRTEFSLTWK